MKDCKNQMVFQQGYRTGQKTSKIADEKVNKAKDSQLVFMAVRCYCNGGTAREITKAGEDNIKEIEKAVGMENLEITHGMVWRRLSDLRDNKHLRNGDPRECKILGRKCLTWWVQ
ncbi:MAG: hypothetical protein V3U75_04185 [Methylococcaceae bacterium]